MVQGETVATSMRVFFVSAFSKRCSAKALRSAFDGVLLRPHGARLNRSGVLVRLHGARSEPGGVLLRLRGERLQLLHMVAEKCNADVGPRSGRCRSDVGPMSLRRQADVAPMSLWHRSELLRCCSIGQCICTTVYVYTRAWRDAV